MMWPRKRVYLTWNSDFGRLTASPCSTYFSRTFSTIAWCSSSVSPPKISISSKYQTHPSTSFISNKKFTSGYSASASRHPIVSSASSVLGVSGHYQTDLTSLHSPPPWILVCNSNSSYLLFSMLHISQSRSQCHFILLWIFNTNLTSCRLQFKLLIFILADALTRSLPPWIPTIYSLACTMLVFCLMYQPRLSLIFCNHHFIFIVFCLCFPILAVCFPTPAVLCPTRSC